MCNRFLSTFFSFFLQMTSSSGDEYIPYRKTFPLHDAAEAGDMETLTRILRPPKKIVGGVGGTGKGGEALGVSIKLKGYERGDEVMELHSLEGGVKSGNVSVEYL